MIRRPPRSTLDRSSAASDVYKRQEYDQIMQAIRSGQQGKIMDITDDEDGERVEIFVE